MRAHRLCISLAFIAACGNEPAPSGTAEADPPLPLGGKADDPGPPYSRPGDYLYRVTLESLETTSGTLNHGADEVFSDFPTPCLQEGCRSPGPRSWDDDHAYLSVATASPATGLLRLPGQVYDDGADNYFATQYWDDGAHAYLSQRVDRPEPPGVARRPQGRNPRPPATMVLENVPLADTADVQLAIGVVADSRTDPSNRDALRAAQGDNLCYARARAESGALGRGNDLLPHVPVTGPGCGPIWSAPTGPGAMPVRFGQSVSYGCDDYVFFQTYLLKGDDLRRETEQGATYRGGDDQVVPADAGCWIWEPANNNAGSMLPPHRAAQNHAASRRVRIRIERTGYVQPSFGPPLTPVDCTLRPIGPGTALDLAGSWGDKSVWQDQLRAIITPGHLRTIPPGADAHTHEGGTRPLDRDGSLVFGRAESLTAYASDSCLGCRFLSRSVPKPVSPRCKPAFSNVKCWTSPFGQQVCGIDNGSDHDSVDTMHVGTDVRLGLYGEFDPHGKLLQKRVRYLRGSLDYLLRPLVQPPR